MSTAIKTFSVDAVLFDMDGTLTDSIAAVEAAWGKVAKDIGQDPEYVIAATHGKRAVDNLSQFKPQLAASEIDAEVERFENTILYYADAHHLHSGAPSGAATPALSTDVSSVVSSMPSSRRSSNAAATASPSGRRPSFGARLFNMLNIAAHMRAMAQDQGNEEGALGQVMEEGADEYEADVRHAWQIEAASVDRSVRILPGVRSLIDSLPEGRYAVATSGAKTYAYGCMLRVGITPPAVTITADDKRLKAGKPAPDPFLLAAECLGYDAKRCVVFEDSPSGIRAGVASGAIVVAVCTSHERSKIENCGAHYLVENMNDVHCEVVEDGRLKFTVQTLA